MIKNKKNNNIIFLFIICISLIILLIINYKADPYSYFHKTNLAAQIPIDESSVADLHIKCSRNKKRENLIIGCSEVITMYGDGPLDNIFNYLYLESNVVKFKNYYEILKLYLEIHPETKNIILFINYPSFYIFNKDRKNSKYKYLTLQEIFYLLFSFNTTKESLKYITDNIVHRNDKRNNALNYNDTGLYKPYLLTYYYKNTEVSFPETSKDIKYIDNIVSLLKEKNINYYVLIPPYSSITLYTIYSNKIATKELNRIKKILVKKFGTVYDTAFINKYTRMNLGNINYLHKDNNHPNWIYGIKIYKLFFDKENAENDIVMILNKENIEESLKKQQELYNEYYAKNKKVIANYLKIPEVINENLALTAPSINWGKDDLPKELSKEIEYGQNIRENQLSKEKNNI